MVARYCFVSILGTETGVDLCDVNDGSAVRVARVRACVRLPGASRRRSFLPQFQLLCKAFQLGVR